MAGPLRAMPTMTPEEEGVWNRDLRAGRVFKAVPCGHALEDVPFPVAAWRPGFPPVYVGLAFHWRHICPRCESAEVKDGYGAKYTQ